MTDKTRTAEPTPCRHDGCTWDTRGTLNGAGLCPALVDRCRRLDSGQPPREVMADGMPPDCLIWQGHNGEDPPA